MLKLVNLVCKKVVKSKFLSFIQQIVTGFPIFIYQNCFFFFWSLEKDFSTDYFSTPGFTKNSYTFEKQEPFLLQTQI